jgi:hypothetical protein
MKEKGSKAKVTRMTRPPLSPHRTLLGIFMWGYVDNNVCSEKICNRHHLHGRIYIAVMTVTLDMIVIPGTNTKIKRMSAGLQTMLTLKLIMDIKKSLKVHLHIEYIFNFFYIS